jgi:flagellar basal body rod protein FlgG
MTVSTRGMMTPMAVLNVHTDNIANFGVPGYQRKDPIVTSFTEFLGPNGVDISTSTDIGRIRLSGNPLDLALSTPGYFQKVGTSGAIELTRDGRFHLDKDGYLRALDEKKVLGANGQPVRIPKVPYNLDKEFKIAANGDITVYDPKKGDKVFVGKLAVVSQDGAAAKEVDVKQGFIEDSNVYLAKEFVSVMPLRRQFEANRQLFILQSDGLSRMIQELGRAQ